VRGGRHNVPPFNFREPSYQKVRTMVLKLAKAKKVELKNPFMVP